MYSREEAKRIKERFWTTFGQYMTVIPSADGEKINWINYKTGVKHLSFRMDADNKSAKIMIELSHPDEDIRVLMFEHFVSLKSMLTESLQEDWEWDVVYYDEQDKKTSRISISMDKVSIFKQEDWPTLIPFFKTRIIALDDFWSMAKYTFDIFK